jgi:hypothetical protein
MLRNVHMLTGSGVGVAGLRASSSRITLAALSLLAYCCSPETTAWAAAPLPFVSPDDLISTQAASNAVQSGVQSQLQSVRDFIQARRPRVGSTG